MLIDIMSNIQGDVREQYVMRTNMEKVELYGNYTFLYPTFKQISEGFDKCMRAKKGEKKQPMPRNFLYIVKRQVEEEKDQASMIEQKTKKIISLCQENFNSIHEEMASQQESLYTKLDAARKKINK